MFSVDKEKCLRCGKCARLCPMGYLKMGQEGPEARGKLCIECMHCAAACPSKAVRFDGITEEALYPAAPENAAERILMTRRSYRRFKKEAPPRELIERALSLSNYAPSGKNRHANRWTVVYGAEAAGALRDEILAWCAETGEATELIRFSQRGFDILTCGAPCVIIGWSPDDALNPCVDTVIAMSHAELILQSYGVGSCWGGYMNQIAGHWPELRKRFGVPEGASVQCALMVGWPENESYPNLPWRPGADINWIE